MKERKWLRYVVMFLLALVIAVPVIGTQQAQEAQAATTVAKGTCGDNVTWTLSSSGKLTISGTGAMDDSYDNYSALWSGNNSNGAGAPWYDYCEDITSVVIKSGVTSVTSMAFAVCENLKKISISDTVTTITDRTEGDYASWGSLTTITVSEDNTKYSSVDGVLYNKKQTTLLWYPTAKSKGGSFTIPSTVTKIGTCAFDGVYLSKITVPASVTKVNASGFGIHYGSYTYKKYGYTYLTLVFQGSAPKFSSYWSDSTGGSDYLIKYPASEASSWEDLGMEDWYGVSSKAYKLSVKSVADITLSSTKLTYTGSKRTPSVTVEINGETLTKNTDYTLTWSSSTRKAIGKYTVTITGTGDYTGSVTKTFKIVPKKVTLKSSTKSSSSGKITVKWSKVSGAGKYQIAYKVKGGSWKYKTVSASTYSKTLSSLKSGKYYYVKVRAYKTVDGTKYYGSWSSTKKIKVK